ncbi:unnamed protein product [Toxocara canis]|uniref:PH domain-containing protein n=1 Tax=Toxocara canis TaxID=6265 RepID=A0A183UGL8_TOXCA|nr:unnamed protein product [Toxocara canis]
MPVDVAGSTPHADVATHSFKSTDVGRDAVPVFTEARAAGILYKWTNYVLGWQQRYFELEDGVLVYYKTKGEKQFGSRGSITVRCALIAENEVDLCRFDVATSGVIWYLKAENIAAKSVWMNALNAYTLARGQQAHGEAVEHPELYGRMRVLTGADGTLYEGELKGKVKKLEKYRQLALRQVERIEHRVGAASQRCMSQVEKDSILEEGIALSATTSAIISHIADCIDILNEQVSGEGVPEPVPEMRTDARTTSSQTDSSKIAETVLSDDEQDWHDARDLSLDMRSDVEFSADAVTAASCMSEETECSLSPSGLLTLPNCHSLSAEINRITMEQLRYAKAGVEDQVWQLFSEEGEMRMYKREVEIDGLVCDPLKATHTVNGVSAREFIHFFFEPGYKMTWDETVDNVNVVETISADTLVIHQVLISMNF